MNKLYLLFLPILTSCQLFQKYDVKPLVEGQAAMKMIFDNQTAAFEHVIELAKKANADRLVITALQNGVSANTSQYNAINDKFLQVAAEFNAVNWRDQYEKALSIIKELRSKQ